MALEMAFEGEMGPPRFCTYGKDGHLKLEVSD